MRKCWWLWWLSVATVRISPSEPEFLLPQASIKQQLGPHIAETLSTQSCHSSQAPQRRRSKLWFHRSINFPRSTTPSLNMVNPILTPRPEERREVQPTGAAALHLTSAQVILRLASSERLRSTTTAICRKRPAAIHVRDHTATCHSRRIRHSTETAHITTLVPMINQDSVVRVAARGMLRAHHQCASQEH